VSDVLQLANLAHEVLGHSTEAGFEGLQNSLPTLLTLDVVSEFSEGGRINFEHGSRSSCGDDQAMGH
jgi:hypothetical protein